MRLYGAIQKVEPQDDGTVRVHGIATSEAVDEQGEIVRADAIRAAIPDYMRFPALREMHQLSAAGTTLEAEVCEDGTTRIVAHVVDPVAVAKVRNQVYRGFSIGGRITQRDGGNPKAITGLVLNEISLVDRPANPEAIFDCWKAVMPPDAPLSFAEPHVAKAGPADSEQGLVRQPFNAPIQVWACTVPDHRHLAKIDALKCLKGDAVLAEDGAAKEIAAAWKQKIGTEEAASAEADDNASSACLAKPLRNLSQNVARVIADIGWLREALDLEAANENDPSPQLARLQAIITELCDFLSSLANGEAGEIPDETGADGASLPAAMHVMASTAAGASDLERVAASLRKGSPNTRQLAGGAMKAKHSRADQALLDVARAACDQCLKIDGLSVDERTNLDRARHHLRELGATPTVLLTNERTADDGPSSLRPECLIGDSLELDELQPPAQLASEMGKRTADLADTLPDERPEKVALAKILGEMVPMIERLTKRVDEIARIPLPPLTMAKGTVSVSKQQDRGRSIGSADPELSPEAIAAALAKMSKEEQTLTLIKASYATPIRISGSAVDQR